MREVIVTAGTRAAGKSTFCEKTIALIPSIVEVSRDKILIELFGSTSLSPYGGGHYYAYEKMWEAVKKVLQAPKVTMILDVWNGDSEERKSIIKQLRKLGADRVVVWYFTTPVETVSEWFWRKPGIAKMGDTSPRTDGKVGYYSEDAPVNDHKLFHLYAEDIDSDGFDEVIRVNPLTMNPGDIIPMQTSLVL